WIIVIALLPGVLLAQEEVPAKGTKTKGAKQAAPAFDGVQDQASYAIGVNIGRSLAEEDAEINTELLIQGLRDALAKKKLALTDADMQKAMTAFSKEAQVRAEAKAKELGEKNKKEGDVFLAENKKKKGVTTSKTGLQSKVIIAGDGESPKKTDTVKVHYHGTLLDGTVFDSSVERMEPAEFPVDRVIPGWTEALLGMKVGDKWQIVIPAELGYGERGNGPIPANAVLVFDVELLGIVE
ncbi:MAG: FKBP-type peptidyl-prolyl cis-trans isomerase, partial [Pirellulaceae bacterium]